MSFWELFITCFSLSLDAFSVSISKSISLQKISFSVYLRIVLFFTLFQVLMPVYGYLLGNKFYGFISSIDHYIIFMILSVIGFNMIRESRNVSDNIDCSVDVKTLFVLAVATSIDALAAGITFDFLNILLYRALLIIGLVTFFMCSVGVLLGKKMGEKVQGNASFFGGFILIVIGIKTLVVHLFF